MKTVVGSLLLVVALLATCATASIENEPVRVTHRNSGPRYDIDEVERTRISAPESPEGPLVNQRHPDSEDGEPTGIGHVSIRRIFLVPMMPPQSSDSAPGSLWSSSETTRSERPPTMSRPFWPFMTPHRHHLFGEDAASRPPAAAEESTGERENSPAASGTSLERAGSSERGQQGFDPMQLMVELLRQALNQAILTPNEPPKSTAEEELNKEASSTGNEKRRVEPAGSGSGLFGAPPMRPGNETKEDIVEIDGKKYMRKTVINRHVGENLIFMTKRLIFVPLNETTSESTTTGAPAVVSPKTDAPVEATTTTTTQVNSATTERPVPPGDVVSTTPAQEEERTSTVAASEASVTSTTPPAAPAEATTKATEVESTREEATTPKSSLADTVSDIINKAAERLVNQPETGSSTTSKPVTA